MRKISRTVLAIGVTAALALGTMTVFTESAEAACRIMPVCWANADCDALCGVGLGRCVHAKCPVRVCKCS